MRTLVSAIILSLAVVMPPPKVGDAGHGSPSVRVDAAPGVFAGAPALAGYIYNDGPYRITNVRLKVAALDRNGVVIEEVMGWVEGDIAARSRGYFMVTMTRTALSHRVTVVSFDMVSRGGVDGVAWSPVAIARASPRPQAGLIVWLQARTQIDAYRSANRLAVSSVRHARAPTSSRNSR